MAPTDRDEMLRLAEQWERAAIAAARAYIPLASAEKIAAAFDIADRLRSRAGEDR